MNVARLWADYEAEKIAAHHAYLRKFCQCGQVVEVIGNIATCRTCKISHRLPKERV